MKVTTLDAINMATVRSENMRFEELKVSYIILKPNAAKHYAAILEDIRINQFSVLGQYAILDYETVNMALHIDQPESMQYLIPISRMYKDFYSNYAVIVALGKKNISYDNMCIQVTWLKQYLQSKYDLPYISYVFNTYELGEENKHQRLLILSKEGRPEKKSRFNEDGTYLVFFTNEIHSPDADVNTTIKELNLLKSMGLFEECNQLPEPMIENISRYSTFEFMRDLIK